jgi:two-component system LytT family response regulator
MSNPEKPILAVIIDDEKSARETLKAMIDLYCPGVKILGEADGIEAGRELILRLNPELIFLDVEMPTGTGFDLIKGMDNVSAQIIFTTAYAHYAINAIKLPALDYLLKPVNRQELIAAVAKMKRKEPALQHEVLDLLKQQLDSKKEQSERLVITSLQGFEVIKISDILYCEGERNYTTFHLNNKEALLSSKTLKEYEMMLPSTTFIRVHQSYLVNINYVKRYLKGRGGTLIMANGKNIEVSKNKKQLLIDALG